MVAVYPTFEIVEGMGLIPKIYLPKNFEKLVQNFYNEGRKEDVEEYAGSLEKELSLEENIHLQWDEKRGLTTISLIGAGLDLSEIGTPHFQSHNIGTHNGIPLGLVAMKYISELIKSKD